MPMSSCGIPLFLMEPFRTPICSQKCPPSLVVFAVDPSSQIQEFQEQCHGAVCFSRPKIPPQLAPYLSGTETSTNMITGELKSQVDKIWEAFWTGGISNPISVIEQFTYLLFIRRLDEEQLKEEKKAALVGIPMKKVLFTEAQKPLRWNQFKNEDPETMFGRFTNPTVDGMSVFEPPFTDQSDQGIMGIFTEDAEVRTIIRIIDGINANAQVA